MRERAISFVAKGLGPEGVAAQAEGDPDPLAGAAIYRPHQLYGAGHHWVGHEGRPAPRVAAFLAEMLK